MSTIPPMFRGVTWNDTKRRGRPAVVGALLTGVLASGLGAAPAALASTPTPAVSATAGTAAVIVRATTGGLDRAAAAVVRLGGTVEREMTALGTLSASVPSSAVTALRAASGVAAVTANAGVQLQDTAPEGLGSYNEVADPESVYNSLRAMGANKFYANGFTGEGVDVAVIDSGTSPVGGLDKPGQVIVGPDLTEESQDPAVAGFDTNGHGTFMAGLIAGKDDAWSPTNTATTFAGAAPDARIISVKAADAVGATDVSQVIAAIDWVVQHKNDNGMNIRVLNLSFGTDGLQAYTMDPLSYAVEVAWKKGIFVVVSAGNHGAGRRGTMTNPATNPFVLAVGAEDTQSTVDRSDDTIPDFSSWGSRERKPDLVTPGKSVTSLRVPGGYLDSEHPKARVGDRFFRGSGTSQSAAYASGAAALIIQQRPRITPDQLKDLLKRSAVRLNDADSVAQGSGALDLVRAYNTPTNTMAVQLHKPSVGLGTIEGARGGYHLTLNGVTLEGEQDIFGTPFHSATWAPSAALGTSWKDGEWNGRQWTGAGWSGVGWSGVSWSGVGWSGVGWSGVGWSGVGWSGVGWSGVGWSGVGWSGVGWSGVGWSGVGWSGVGWSGVGWSSADWS
ncbi:MAG: Serine protease AprX [Frankiales bacterium]|jgi:hypothetical protein|nr:Serine protease AprX [Frankiales bacterium]